MEKEVRLIDANAYPCQNCEVSYCYKNCEKFNAWFKGTVVAAPVVRGRWEQVQRWATKAKYRCSVCGREVMSAIKVNIEKYPYCHCGAKMDGDGDAK